MRKRIKISNDVLTEIRQRAISNYEASDAVLRRVFGLEKIDYKRRGQYDVSDLKVGETIQIPWQFDAHENPINKNQVNRAVLNEQKRSGKRFNREGRVMGLRVTRIK